VKIKYQIYKLNNAKGKEVMQMRIQHISKLVVLSGMLSLASAGAAMAADGTADINTTGPNSNNTVNIREDTNVTETNTNHVSVDNNNDQTARSGSAVVSGNTLGGEAVSGNASNFNATTTNVKISNVSAVSAEACCGLGAGPGFGGGLGSGGGAGSGAGAPGVGAGAPVSPGLGAAAPGLGAGALPEVGCSVVCDVSALRAGYNPNNNAVTEATKQAKGLSAWLMAMAAALSLAGAGGSALYATKRVKV
jgi:hypothetical protein